MNESTGSIQPAVPIPSRKNSPARDAATIDILIALYIMLFFICGMIMGAILLIMVLPPMIFGIFSDLIFMVLLDKVQHTGIFLIMDLIIGLMVIFMASGGVMCYMMIAGGVVVEVIYWLMGHKSFASMTAAYTAFVTFFALGEYILSVWIGGAYLELYANSPTLNMTEVGMDVLNPATMTMYYLLAIVVCVAGRFWSRALTHGQFFRVGMV